MTEGVDSIHSFLFGGVEGPFWALRNLEKNSVPFVGGTCEGWAARCHVKKSRQRLVLWGDGRWFQPNQPLKRCWLVGDFHQLGQTWGQFIWSSYNGSAIRTFWAKPINKSSIQLLKRCIKRSALKEKTIVLCLEFTGFLLKSNYVIITFFWWCRMLSNTPKMETAHLFQERYVMLGSVFGGSLLKDSRCLFLIRFFISTQMSWVILIISLLINYKWLKWQFLYLISSNFDSSINIGICAFTCLLNLWNSCLMIFVFNHICCWRQMVSAIVLSLSSTTILSSILNNAAQHVLLSMSQMSRP